MSLPRNLEFLRKTLKGRGGFLGRLTLELLSNLNQIQFPKVFRKTENLISVAFNKKYQYLTLMCKLSFLWFDLIGSYQRIFILCCILYYLSV